MLRITITIDIIFRTLVTTQGIMMMAETKIVNNATPEDNMVGMLVRRIQRQRVWIRSSQINLKVMPKLN